MRTTKATRQETLNETASRVQPAGGNGNLPWDIIIRNGSGARVWDLHGTEYVDYLLGSGPLLVGHAHPEVMDAVAKQLKDGTTYFLNNRPAILLAEMIVEAVACAKQVRFTSSGSEATLYAMRIARAHRRREKILKFEGGFHGMNDYALMSMAPKGKSNYPRPIADSPGIPAAVSNDVLIAPFNDADAAAAIIDEYHDELAGVIVEPFQRLIPPQPGFLETLRAVTLRYDIPLIFDEIVTGFRFAYGGAQQYYGIVPDLCTLGKVIGGGFPLAAVAGSSRLMSHFDPKLSGDGFVMQIGTLNGNPVAATAGVATLEILRRPGIYDRLFKTGEQLRTALSQVIERVGIDAQIVGESPLFDVVFARRPVRNYMDTHEADNNLLDAVNLSLLKRGVLKSDTKFYLSTVHGQDDIKFTADTYAAALAEALDQRSSN